MSNHIPASRAELKTWCMRKLGWPVIQIAVDDDQLEDRVEEALQFFQDFHFDAVERWFLQYQLTSTDITNKYIPITESIIGVTRIFPLSGTTNAGNIFDYTYQWRLNEMPNLTTTTFTNYVLTRQHMETFAMLFVGQPAIRFNRHSDRLYIDWNWQEHNAGEYIVVEGYIILDPDSYTDVYNDRMLKNYLTALIKRQWGANMSKAAGIKLIGGVTLNGLELYAQAQQEIDILEKEIRSTYEEPPSFFMG